MSFPWIVVCGSCVVAGLSWCTVAIIRNLALRWNIVDIPNERSSHRAPTPLCGGIALVLLSLGSWMVLPALNAGVSLRHALLFVVSSSLIAVTSLLDDVYHVSYRVRFLAQGVAAAIFIVGYAHFDVVSVPAIGTLSLGALGVVVTVIWFIGMTNAYNFMDGIDGMVGGQTAVAGLGWVILGMITDHRFLVVLGACLAASSLGFLAHNWYPARIFMGDIGATYLGFTLAAMTVVAAAHDPRLALAGALLVWPSIFDTSFTVIRRLTHGHNIFAGHRSFLFHRLIHVGWSHSAASALYIPLPIIGAVLAATWEYGSRGLHTLVVAATLSSCLTLWAIVRHQEWSHAEKDDVAEALRAGAAVHAESPAQPRAS